MHEPALQDGTSTAPFDPDSRAAQPEESLLALIDRVETGWRNVRLPAFSQADALELGLLLVELGTTRNLPIAVDIRRAGHVLFHASLPGATLDNEGWVERKSRTAERYAEPSLLVGLRGRRGGSRMEDNAWFDQQLYAAHGGAVPLVVAGTGMVAIATVSGLPQQDDHDLVVEALTLFLGDRSGAGRP